MTEDQSIRAAFITTISSLSTPLYNKISKMIHDLATPNLPDKLTSQFLDILERAAFFDASFDCTMDKCIALLLLKPNDCFDSLFNFLKYPDLKRQSPFCPTGITLKKSDYLSKLDGEFSNPSLIIKCIAYFIIDRFLAIFLLRILRKVENIPNVDLSAVFTLFFIPHFNNLNLNQGADGFITVMNQESESNEFFDALKIQKLNMIYWARIIHSSSKKQPIEAYYFLVESFTNYENSKESLAFVCSLFKFFPFDSLYDNDIQNLSSSLSFEKLLTSVVERVTRIDDFHISGSLFFMNLVARELIIKKRYDTTIMKLILENVSKSIKLTPAALPIASIFVIYSQENKALNIEFTADDIISSAINFFTNNVIAGAYSVLLLYTFIHLLSTTNTFINDIYLNGIQLPSFPITTSLIPEDRIQIIYQKVLTYGSFNDTKYELANLLLNIAALDFHSFVTTKLNEVISNQLFLRFNSYPIFYFFREVLINETIKKNSPDDYAIFQKVVLDFFIKYQNEKPASKIPIFSIHTIIPKNLMDSYELIQCARDECFYDLSKQINFDKSFLNHIYEFIAPKPMVFPVPSMKIKTDIEIWSKIFSKKKDKIFNEIKTNKEFLNCKIQKENQPIALLLSLFPLIEINTDQLLSIVPLVLNASPQIASIAVFVIRYYIQKDNSLITKIMPVLLKQEIQTLEHLFNLLYSIHIFVTVISNSNLAEVFTQIQEILIIGLCCDRREIRNLVFSITDKLNLPQFGAFDNEKCFQSFYRKLKILSYPLSQDIKIMQIPYRSYRDVALTNYEYIHSVYLSVIFDYIKFDFADKSLSLIQSFYQRLKKNNENELFIVNLLTFLACYTDNEDSLHLRMSLYTEFTSMKDEAVLINYASAFNDILSLTNHFIENPNILPSVSLIEWYRYPNENSLSILLNVLPDVIEKLYSNDLDAFFSESGHEIIIDHDMKTMLSLIQILNKMFKFYEKSHSEKPISLFLRVNFCPDIFEFFGYENKKEIVFKFVLYSALTHDIKEIGRKALHSFCSVTTFSNKTIPYYEYISQFHKTIRTITCQSPHFIEVMLNQIESGDDSCYPVMASLFSQINSTADSSELITEHLNTLYDNYLFGLNQDWNNDELMISIKYGLTFTNMIYNLAGKIIAASLRHFPSNDSINTLKNLALTFSLIRIFIQKQNDEKTKRNFSLLLNFLENPTNDVLILSKYLSKAFDFCLDQFLKEAFDLSNKILLPNFVLALTPWMKLIHLDLEALPLSLSDKTDDCFKFCLTSISLVKIICKFDLYDLINILIANNKTNIESLFILSLRYFKEKFIQRIIKNKPICIDYIRIYFSFSYWRYQVVQLRKLGDEFYNQIDHELLNISPDQHAIEYDKSSDDILEVHRFLLGKVIPPIFIDSFNLFSQLFSIRANLKNTEDLFHMSSEVSEEFDSMESIDLDKPINYSLIKTDAFRIQKLINNVIAFCIAFQKKDFVKEFTSHYPFFMKCVLKDDDFFDTLFQWAVLCGDIDASLNTALYIVQNFNSFQSVFVTSKRIEKVIETITILTLAINNKNQSKTMNITGDRYFSFIPYYHYIATLIELLSLITISYNYQFVSNSKQCIEINSKVFWFLCEFLLTSNKTFSVIFEKVVHALYVIIDNNLQIDDHSNTSSQTFDGILLLILKNDIDFAKNCTPNIVEEINRIAFSLLMKSKFYHLIGDIDRFTYQKDKRKSNIASIALFLLPFSKFDKNSSIYNLISKEFGIELDSIQKTIEILLDFCVPSIVNYVFHFYLFCSKNQPLMISTLFELSTIILSSKNIGFSNESQIVISTEILSKLAQIALKDQDSSNSISACSFLEQYSKIGGTFEQVSIPHIDLKFPVTNLPFNLEQCLIDATQQPANDSLFRATKSSSTIFNSAQNIDLTTSMLQKKNPHSQSSLQIFMKNQYDLSNEIIEAVDLGCQPVYFPSAYEFLSLQFVKELREQECARCKIQPFTKWVDLIFKAENAQDEIGKAADSSEQEFDDHNDKKFNLHDEFMNKSKAEQKIDVQSIINQFVFFVKNSLKYDINASTDDLNNSEKIDKEKNGNATKVKFAHNEEINENDLFSIDVKLFTPSKEDIDSIDQDVFPTVFP